MPAWLVACADSPEPTPAPRLSPPVPPSTSSAASPPISPVATERAATPTPPGPAARVDAYLRAQAAADRFSGAALIARADRVLIEEGYGLANRALRIPNAPRQTFRIGSLTKQFTGMAILLLQERGRLSTQAPVGDYLPELPTAWQPVTIHQMLTHTSGLPSIRIDEYRALRARHVSQAEVIAAVRDRPLEFAPGASWRYNNTAYYLLGQVIERVAGQPYEAFLHTAIFDPLQMHDTGLADDRPALPQALSGYTWCGEGSERRVCAAEHVDIDLAYAAGGLYSTVGDLRRWAAALMSETLAPRRVVEILTTSHVPAPEPDPLYQGGYGYGVNVGELEGHRLVWHSGSVPGFTSFLGFYPDDRLTLIMLSNLETSLDGLARDLARLLLGEGSQ